MFQLHSLSEQVWIEDVSFVPSCSAAAAGTVPGGTAAFLLIGLGLFEIATLAVVSSSTPFPAVEGVLTDVSFFNSN